MPLLTILGITGGAGGGGGGGPFDPVADLPGTDAERVIIDCWDETCLKYSGTIPNFGAEATTNGADLGLIPSKDRFTAHDTWDNLIGSRTELSQDAGFDNAGVWTLSGVSVTGSAAVFSGTSGASATSATGRITQDNDWHCVEVVVSAYTSGRFRVGVGGGATGNTGYFDPGGTGTFYAWLTSDLGTGVIVLESDTAGNAFTGSIASLSVKHVPGNHMYTNVSSNRAARQQDGSSNYVARFTSDGMLTRNNCTVPDVLGVCVAGADDGGAHSIYDSFVAVDANDNLAFGHNGSTGYQQALFTPGTTSVWDSATNISGEFHIWEFTLDWVTTDAWEVWKDDTSQSSGTLSVATDLTETPGVIYRMATSGNGGAELDCDIYGLYIYDASAGRNTDLISWVNDNTGSQLTL